jgi:hypothetical protein
LFEFSLFTNYKKRKKMLLKKLCYIKEKIFYLTFCKLDINCLNSIPRLKLRIKRGDSKMVARGRKQKAYLLK